MPGGVEQTFGWIYECYLRCSADIAAATRKVKLLSILIPTENKIRNIQAAGAQHHPENHEGRRKLPNFIKVHLDVHERSLHVQNGSAFAQALLEGKQCDFVQS